MQFVGMNLHAMTHARSEPPGHPVGGVGCAHTRAQAACEGKVVLPVFDAGTQVKEGNAQAYPLPAGVGPRGVGNAAGVGAGGGGAGAMTLSIICTTPLVATMSRFITVAFPLTWTTSVALRVTSIDGPARVWIL